MIPSVQEPAFGSTGQGSSREAAPVRILLVSSDLRTVEMLCENIQKMAIHVEPCFDAEAAGRKLCRSKFEGVIVDCEPHDESRHLLRTIRNSTSHRAAIVFAVLDRDSERVNAFAAGANFTLTRPLVTKVVSDTLRAALPIMVRERRRYFRCPVQTEVHVTSESGAEVSATSINVSEGGIAFRCPAPLQIGEKLRLSFCLPGTLNAINTAAEVCWTNEKNETGVQLLDAAQTVTQRLQVWLSGQLERMTIPIALRTSGHPA